MDELLEICQEIAAICRQRSIRLVAAESCTAGLVGSLLGRVPGASEWFCGSSVVYRNQTKTDWLGVPAEILDDPAIGPVSEPTAAALCDGLLRSTSEADFAVSVTGHLGPHSPAGFDGVIFIATRGRSHPADVTRHQLQTPEPSGPNPSPRRLARQQEAATIVLSTVLSSLQSPIP